MLKKASKLVLTFILTAALTLGVFAVASAGGPGGATPQGCTISDPSTICD